MEFEENIRTKIKASSEIWATLYDEQDQSWPAAEIINEPEICFENKLSDQRNYSPNYQN